MPSIGLGIGLSRIRHIVSAAVKRAFNFDGTNDAVRLGSSVALTGTFSVSLWFSWDGATSRAFLGNQANTTNLLWITNATTLFVETASASSSFTVPSISTGTWHHLKVTRDGANLVTVQVDGTTAATATIAGTMTWDQIGARGSTFTNPFDGRLFDLHIYSDVLTAGEFTYLNTFGASGDNPGTGNLQVNLRMNEASGTNANDNGPLNNDGTINNAESGFYYTGADVPHAY